MNDNAKTPSTYSAIVLAAGYSSRMDDFKPLLNIGGETIADRVIASFLKNRVDVLLVTGWREDELLSGIKHKDIAIVRNPNFESGMFSSVQAAVCHLSPACRAFFVMPVDIPLVRPQTIRRLLDAAHRYPGRILYPVFEGVRGHPTLIPRSIASDIIGWRKDGGLKAVLNSHPEIQVEIEVPDENILLDVDSKGDFAVALDRLSHYDIPTDRECDTMFEIAGTASNIRLHCRKVAVVAVAMARALVAAGRRVDMEAVRSAATLHDIAKQYGDHDAIGAQMLHSFGFRRIADIIAVHTDLGWDEATASLESKIVYLADKFVRNEEIVSIEERYHSAARKYGFSMGAVSWIQAGKQQALEVKRQMEVLLGCPLDTVVGS